MKNCTGPYRDQSPVYYQHAIDEIQAAQREHFGWASDEQLWEIAVSTLLRTAESPRKLLRFLSDDAPESICKVACQSLLAAFYQQLRTRAEERELSQPPKKGTPDNE